MPCERSCAGRTFSRCRLQSGPKQSIALSLEGVDLELHQGEFVGLLGPNGTGKSTLLRTFGRMQPSLGGSVEIDGRDIHHLSNHALATLLSVVLTDRLAVGRLTAYELVGLGRYPYTGWAAGLTHADHRIIQWAIRATRSDDLAARDISELSDGERQRVMIARALAQQPTVMLLDETHCVSGPAHSC